MHQVRGVLVMGLPHLVCLNAGALHAQPRCLHALTTQPLGLSHPCAMHEPCMGPCPSPCSASGQLDLLGLLRPLLAAATAPELSLSAYSTSGISGSWGDALSGGQTVAAGWHAAAVAAALCSSGSGQVQALQDALVSRGLLPLLARFATADVPLLPARAAAGAAAGPSVGAGRRLDELLMAVK